MNRSVFFAAIRKSLFGGALKKEQVDGIERIFDYWQAEWPRMPIEELAYVLATVRWETGHTFQPIREKGGEKARYAPYYGRGLVQITWKANYDKFGIKDPDEALEWPVALRCLFEGMIYGRFTGHKLADYITLERQDYVGARRIVNGTDKAEKIAGYAVKFLAALRAAEAAPVKESEKPKVSGAVKTGSVATGGGLIVAGGTNIAQGGSDWASALSIGAGILAVVAPWIVEKFKKSPSPAVEMPAPKPPPPEEEEIQPLEITVSQTAGLDAAVAHRRAIEAELADAMAHEADERRKLWERLDALRAAIAESERETAPKNAPAISAGQKTPVDSGEYQGA